MLLLRIYIAVVLAFDSQLIWRCDISLLSIGWNSLTCIHTDIALLTLLLTVCLLLRCFCSCGVDVCSIPCGHRRNTLIGCMVLNISQPFIDNQNDRRCFICWVICFWIILFTFMITFKSTTPVGIGILTGSRLFQNLYAFTFITDQIMRQFRFQYPTSKYLTLTVGKEICINIHISTCNNFCCRCAGHLTF